MFTKQELKTIHKIMENEIYRMKHQYKKKQAVSILGRVAEQIIEYPNMWED